MNLYKAEYQRLAQPSWSYTGPLVQHIKFLLVLQHCGTLLGTLVAICNDSFASSLRSPASSSPHVYMVLAWPGPARPALEGYH